MQIRRSTTLAPEDWERWDSLAVQTNSLATTGPDFDKPSWRALFRRVVRNKKIMAFIAKELNAT